MLDFKMYNKAAMNGKKRETEGVQGCPTMSNYWILTKAVKQFSGGKNVFLI